MRNLIKTLAVISLLAPASGYSLGIGDIKLHSALNQNLDADISLVVSAGEKASDIKVNFAQPDKFDEAGVPWTSFLSKIKFATVVGTNGSVIIKLSSREAVKEPFLDFLLEVNWPKGSLYREFTVLLDPPPVYKQAILSVSTSSESYEPKQAVIPQHLSNQRLQASAERSLSGASEYGPTRRNDTLWKVAEQASRQVGVSVEQMMVAMYEENPRAFYKENVHALSAGKKLKIPERDVVLKFSRKQALAEFNRQTKAWKNRLASVPNEAESAKKDTPDNQLTLVAPTEADVAENIIIDPENEQVTAKKKVDDAASKTIDKEVASVVSPVNDALQDKVSELEKQLAMMQQLLALKDQQLAALQNQTQTKPVAQPEAVQAITSGQVGTVNPVTQQKPVQPDVKPVIQPEPETVSSLSTYYLWVGGVGAGTLSLLGWFWWRKRKLDERSNSQSLFASSSMSKIPESNDHFTTSIEKDSAKIVDAGGKSSFLGELTFGDFDAFDTDQGEIDPISEADVYLAYGRYQQAEELMRDVIKDQPGRDDCKLKLLEIFYSNGNKPAFETYANELAKAGKKDDVEFWAKVAEMGSEICQDSTLFSSEDEVIEEQQNNESIDFDLSTIATKTDESNETLESVVSKTQGVEVNNEFESFDFDFGLNEIEVKGIDSNVDKESVDNYPLNDSSTDKSSGLIGSFANDSFNRNFYFDRPVSGPNGEDFDQQEVLEVFDLTDMDELETKLDLAKAYIDMSDAEAAKDMASEVLEKGTVEQKKVAQALLNDLK